MSERTHAKAKATSPPSFAPAISGLLPRTRSSHEASENAKSGDAQTHAPNSFGHHFSRVRVGLQTKLAVNQPGDTFEQEADRIAETVVGGNAKSFQQQAAHQVISPIVQREETKSPPSDEEKYKEGAKKVGEAFLETAVGKSIKERASKLGEKFVATLRGKIIAGTIAAGAVSAIVATDSELPMQVPEIPLDSVYPGLKMKLTYEGPAQKPTAASISFTYTIGAGDADKKKPGMSESEKFRSETARLSADQAKFREGLKSPKERADEAAMWDSYWRMRMSDPLNPLNIPGLKPKKGNEPLLPKKQEDSTIMRKATGGTLHADDKNAHGKNAHGKHGGGVPSIVHETLAGGGGRPLDAATRRLMESRFGHDFNRVRVHTDARAAESARAINASAYTLNRDIVFAKDSYAPTTHAGARLLAHELTHTIQQSGGDPSPFARDTAATSISHPHDRAEIEATNAASDVSAARPVKINTRTSNRVSRQPAEPSLAEVVRGMRDAVRTALDFQNAYEYLNGLEIGHLLNRLAELKSLGYLEGLIKNLDVASGVHRERLRAAMHAVERQGKTTSKQFAEDFKTSLMEVTHADQRNAIISFVEQPAAGNTGSNAPAASDASASSSAPAAPAAPTAFKTSNYAMSATPVTLVKAREENKDKKIEGRAEVKESPADFTAEILKMAGYTDASAWYGSFTSIKFLGFTVSNIHTDLAAHLKGVEAKFVEQHGGDTKDPATAGKALGLKQDIGGGRPAPTGTAVSMHLFGLAIDVNYDSNPWIAEESSQKRENEILKRISLLVTGTETAFVPQKMSYDEISALNDSVKTYFSYLDDNPALEAKLKGATGTWAGKPLDAALKQVQADFDELAIKWERTGTKKDIVKSGGFFDLKKEFVEGIGLDWGGKYGDMMHFDMRNKGSGAKIEAARLRYKSQQIKASELKFDQEHPQ